MKRRFIVAIILFSTSFLIARLPISSIITFYIHESPFTNPQDDSTKFNQKIATPGKIANKIANKLTSQSNREIFSTYGGYLVVSNFNGQVTFPRMQQKTDFFLIVTEHIQPVFMIGNTIHHWEIPKIPASFYSITRKQSKETKLFYWDVQPATQPKNNIIPINSIVLFAKPKNIIVPIGITITNDDPQLILPPVYVVKNNTNVIPALETLQVKQFFGTIHLENKKENATYYSSHVITTQ